MTTNHQLLITAVCWCLAISVQAQQTIRDTSNVTPALEIEILDPGVDPLGHPAVLLTESSLEDMQEIDIPPAVLVHRYYYTGDRSFQAQLFPGGPSIVVAHHPKSGQKLYVPVQMLPGAPRVTYTKRAIEYDFGKTKIHVVFCRKDRAVVKYRTGPTVWERVEHTLRTEQLSDLAGSLAHKTRTKTAKAATFTKGTMLFAGDTVGAVTTPIKQLFSIGPLGDIEQRMESRVAQHRRGESEWQLRDAGPRVCEPFRIIARVAQFAVASLAHFR